MFVLPEAKRVRREHLHDSATDSWSDGASETVDTDLQAHLNAHIAKSLGLDTQQEYQKPLQPCTRQALATRNTSDETIGQDKQDGEDDDDDGNQRGEFEFRLFSSVAPTKVTLEDDSAAPREGALARPRPVSFYVATNVAEKLKSEYRFAAVSGEDVLLRSHRPSWGMAYPWKVTSIRVTRKAGVESVGVSTTFADGERRRKRSGKRRRIADRQRLRAEREREETEKKRVMDKEEHFKKKKKKMNRLKKLRKRAKNKEMKGGGRGAVDGGDDGDGGQSSDRSGDD